LLVEDDGALNEVFSLMLDKLGYRVETAFNGQEALAKIAAHKPDLILLDLLMPIMDGKEFLRRFPDTASVPVIVFSNLDTKSEVKDVMDLGARRYMLKAWVTPSELLKVIEDTLRD
jgi:DNA-binding response OmpR family regulator